MRDQKGGRARGREIVGNKVVEREGEREGERESERESESESEFHLFEPHIQKKYLNMISGYKCGSGDPC